MRSLRAGTRNELILLARRKKTLVFLVVSALLPIILAFSFRSLQPLLGLVAVSRAFPIQMLELYTLIWIPLFLFLTIADMFPHEISARTLKLALLRPITRLRVYVSKMLALGISTAAMLAVLAAVCLICNAFLGSQGMGTVDWFGYAKAYAAAFVSMWALASLFVWIAQFFQSASGFLVSAVLLYFAAKIAPFFVKGFSSFSLTAYTGWYTLWLSHSVSAGRLFVTSMFVLSALVLFFSLGYLMFDRKEA